MATRVEHEKIAPEKISCHVYLIQKQPGEDLGARHRHEQSEIIREERVLH